MVCTCQLKWKIAEKQCETINTWWMKEPRVLMPRWRHWSYTTCLAYSSLLSLLALVACVRHGKQDIYRSCCQGFSYPTNVSEQPFGCAPCRIVSIQHKQLLFHKTCLYVPYTCFVEQEWPELSLDLSNPDHPKPRLTRPNFMIFIAHAYSRMRLSAHVVSCLLYLVECGI